MAGGGTSLSGRGGGDGGGGVAAALTALGHRLALAWVPEAAACLMLRLLWCTPRSLSAGGSCAGWAWWQRRVGPAGRWQRAASPCYELEVSQSEH